MQTLAKLEKVAIATFSTRPAKAETALAKFFLLQPFFPGIPGDETAQPFHGRPDGQIGVHTMGIRQPGVFPLLVPHLFPDSFDFWGSFRLI